MKSHHMQDFLCKWKTDFVDIPAMMVVFKLSTWHRHTIFFGYETGV